jgi:uncharacterized protein DUF1236
MEIVMKLYLASAAAAVALMGGMEFAAADDVVVVQPQQQGVVVQEEQPVVVQKQRQVVIEPEQETVIREYVKKKPLASVNLLGLELKLGNPVPDTVELREVPNARYRVAVINDQTVLVDPETHQIVEVLH